MPQPGRRPAQAFDPVVSAPLSSAPDAGKSPAAAFDAVLAKSGKSDGKAKVKRLFVYDDGLAFAAQAALLLYPGAKLERFDTWTKLTAVLAKYGEVEELIIWAHGVDGALLIRDGAASGRARTAQDARDRLAKSQLKVTRAVHFEGCNIMRAPQDAAIIASGVAGPGVSATGYTYYMVVQPITVSGLDAAAAAALLRKWDGWWIGSPSVENLVGAKKRPVYRRWFAQAVNLAKPDPLPDPPANLRKSDFSKLSELEPQLLGNLAESNAFVEKLNEPVEPNGFVVTVSDVQALANEK